MVSIASSSIAGKGIFAQRAIRRNQTIFRVEGPTIHYPFEHDYRVGPHWLQIGSQTWKMPMNGNMWRYINHSCSPNAGLRGKTDVVAMRDIAAGEEMTIDYSITEGGRRWHMRCHCPSPQCRGIIRSAQFLPRELFEKYQEFIPAYLRRVYRAEKTYVDPQQGRHGIFAKHRIELNEHIFRIEGPVVRYQFSPQYHIGYQWVAVDQNEWMIPLRTNPWWSIRHSCQPNVGVIRKQIVVAMRDIEPDEELTVDDSMIEADVRWKRQCYCGAPQCRGIVRSAQFLPPELFEQYKLYMPPFIRNAYLNALTEK